MLRAALFVIDILCTFNFDGETWHDAPQFEELSKHALENFAKPDSTRCIWIMRVQFCKWFPPSYDKSLHGFPEVDASVRELHLVTQVVSMMLVTYSDHDHSNSHEELAVFTTYTFSLCHCFTIVNGIASWNHKGSCYIFPGAAWKAYGSGRKWFSSLKGNWILCATLQHWWLDLPG